MKKNKTKYVALLVALSVIISGFPVYAASIEAGSDSDKQTITEELDEAQNETEAVQMVGKEQTDAEETYNSELDEAVKSTGNRLNYIYIEHPYVTIGETQEIVLSWGDGTELISDMKITVQDENGVTEEWASSNHAENLYLFSKEYLTEGTQNTYEIIDVNFLENGEIQRYTFSEMDVEAEFGVNKGYVGIDELQPLYVEDEEAAGELEMSVVSIDENGETHAQDSIAAALDEAGGESSDLRMGRAGEIVVALDPGHDSTHGGASDGSGLLEQNLTLKIAQYAKAELETYSGVRVYMTRTTASCPYPGTSNSGQCIAKRVQAAANAGASIFVSFHLNSASASSANGAEIIIPNSSWKPQVSVAGKELAEKIMAELVAVGLNKRPTPIYSKDTTVNERYPDGSISDYFAVQIYAKEANIPGIIVEHAFLTNASDVNNFLKTEAGLKKLGVADATGIAKYLGLGTGYWSTDSQGNKYYYENGRKVLGSKKIGGQWYYFNETTGAMLVGWRSAGGTKCYYNSDGTLHFGSKKISGNWYYFDDSGFMLKGWRNDNGKRCYYNSDGILQFDSKKIDGSWYYFDDSGYMLVGWRSVGQKKCYYNENGILQFGAQKINGDWYYFDDSGYALTGWRSVGQKKCYYTEEGILLFGARKISGNWYYFDDSGYALAGWRSVGSKRCYYDGNGVLQFDSKKIDGNWYYFDDSGYALTGWRTTGTKRCYYDNNGVLLFGSQKIDGNWYYFDDSGYALMGWRNVGSNKCYYDSQGRLLFGSQKVNGNWYYFDDSGYMQTGWTKVDGEWRYYGSDGIYDSKPSENSPANPIFLIEGTSSITATKLATYFRSMGAKYPTFYTKSDAPTLEQFCQIYYEEAKAENIKAEVAFAQAMLETGWLKFGGDVLISQYNFAGLGAVGGGSQGVQFSSVREGVRAQIQHLKAYANNKSLVNTQVDPRFHLVKRGTASYVEWLGQKENPTGAGWATNKNYGYLIIRMIKQIK